MASSNRHWPSMYRSTLACNFQQPQPDMNNAGGGKSSLMSSRCEESGRNPEPRPRWNPRPEQIRILEGIFNSGMVNPTRDEIRRIRLQLQEYGPVGDANVFYWFQNRKSRTKHKLRAAAGHLHQSGRVGHLHQPGRVALARAYVPPPPPRDLLVASPPVAAPTSSSSSSSDRSSGSSKSARPAVALASSPASIQQGHLPAATAMELMLSSTPTTTPGLAARQLYYHSQRMAQMPELISSPEPFILQWQQQGGNYLPATELGGVLGGAHMHEQPVVMNPAVSVSPSVLLGLCNEALLGHDCVDISSSNSKQGFGHGQYWNNSTTCGGADLNLSSDDKTDAVSAVIRDDEKARLGGLLHHYGFCSTTTTAAAAAAATSGPLAAHHLPAAADANSTAILLPTTSPAPASNVAATTSAVLIDQLQGLFDAGLIGGTTTPPPTATVVAVARDAGTCAATAQFSVPAMHLDVKVAFGEAAVLVRHTGEPVLVDECGVTVEPLQQDTLYYVLMATN